MFVTTNSLRQYITKYHKYTHNWLYQQLQQLVTKKASKHMQYNIIINNTSLTG